MDDNCGDRPLLGAILVAQGAILADHVDAALTAQAEDGQRLGETLLERGLICKPELDRAVAWQAGKELDEESGFGTGLRAAIERRHRWRRDFQAVFH
jgi:hypothetical protein